MWKHQVAEAEVGLGLVSGVSRNIGGSLIRGDSHNDQCQAAEAEVEGLVSGISQSIGDLEEMPVFGKDKEFTVVISVDYKRTIVEEGEGIHVMSKGNSECPQMPRFWVMRWEAMEGKELVVGMPTIKVLLMIHLSLACSRQWMSKMTPQAFRR